MRQRRDVPPISRNSTRGPVDGDRQYVRARPRDVALDAVLSSHIDPQVISIIRAETFRHA
jgi:hypothetical protein